jgi:uncharacterized membrane protein YphA (DoxX/SURF4 family)
MTVQRLFSAFPDRGPGAGLLLLRAAVGAILLIEGSAYFVAHSAVMPGVLMGPIAVIAGAMLVVGVLTPVAGFTATFVGVLGGALLPPLPTDSFEGWMGRVFFVMVSFAIALLGPGAFSLDAYLFGRREIVIPRQPQAEPPL